MATPHSLQQAVLVVKDPPANAGDVGDKVSIPRWERSPRRGNGNPLQHSCLENALDGESWRTTAPGAAKSRTRLCDWVAAEAQSMGSVSWPLSLGRGGESQPLDHQGALGYACCLTVCARLCDYKARGAGSLFCCLKKPQHCVHCLEHCQCLPMSHDWMNSQSQHQTLHPVGGLTGVLSLWKCPHRGSRHRPWGLMTVPRRDLPLPCVTSSLKMKVWAPEYLWCLLASLNLTVTQVTSLCCQGTLIKKKYSFTYLAAPVLSCGMGRGWVFHLHYVLADGQLWRAGSLVVAFEFLVAACGTFSYNMWHLVLRARMEPRSVHWQLGILATGPQGSPLPICF